MHFLGKGRHFQVNREYCKHPRNKLIGNKDKPNSPNYSTIPLVVVMEKKTTRYAQVFQKKIQLPPTVVERSCINFGFLSNRQELLSRFASHSCLRAFFLTRLVALSSAFATARNFRNKCKFVNEALAVSPFINHKEYIADVYTDCTL